METTGKTQNLDPKFYGRGKIAQRITTAQKNALKSIEDIECAAPDARQKVFKSKTADNNQRSTKEDNWERKVSTDIAQAQAIADENGETGRRVQARRGLHQEE